MLTAENINYRIIGAGYKFSLLNRVPGKSNIHGFPYNNRLKRRVLEMGCI